MTEGAGSETWDGLDQQAWGRLVFDLEVQTGFWFSLVVSADPAACAAMRDATRRWCALDGGVPFHYYPPDPSALPEVPHHLVADPHPGVHWIEAAGGTAPPETWDRAAGRFFLAMNERREAFRHRLEGGVIVCGHVALKRLLRTLAPDLFSIRASIIEPQTGPVVEAQPEPSSENPTGPGRGIGVRLGARWAARAERLASRVGPGAALARFEALDLTVSALFYDDRIADAQEILDMQAELARGLVAQQPRAPWADRLRARVLYRQGVLLWADKRYAESDVALQQALALTVSLEQRFPESLLLRLFRAKLAEALARVAEKQGMRRAALEHDEMAWELVRHLLEEDPDDSWLVARSVRQRLRVASARGRSGDQEGAGGMVLSAVTAAESLVERHPEVETWQDLLVNCHDRWGRWNELHGDLRVAWEHYRGAVDVARRWAKAAPGRPDRLAYLVKTRLRMGNRLARARLPSAARQQLELALAEVETLERRARERSNSETVVDRSARRLYAEAHNALARLASEEGDLDRSRGHREEALKAMIALGDSPEEDPGAARRLAREYLSMGRFLARQGDHVGAVAQTESALRTLAELASNGDEDIDARRSGHRRLVALHLDRGDLEAAILNERAAVSLAERRLDLRGEDVEGLRHVFRERTRLAELLARAGRHLEAADLQGEAITAARRIADLEGSRAAALGRLRRAHEDAAALEEEAGRPGRAREQLREALAVAALEMPGRADRDVVRRIAKRLQKLG